jgi:hypothetical protein
LISCARRVVINNHLTFSPTGNACCPLWAARESVSRINQAPLKTLWLSGQSGPRGWGIFRAVCRDGDYSRITSAVQQFDIDYGEGLLIYLGGVVLRNRKWAAADEGAFLSLATHWSGNHGNKLDDAQLVPLVRKFMRQVIF